MAAYQGHLHATKFSLECGVDVDIRNGYGETSLYWASRNGKLDVVLFLIDQGANAHIGNSNNSTRNPLHIASLNGYLDAVQLMINTGTPVNVRNGS
jgi:ankyrin repeat protein